MAALVDGDDDGGRRAADGHARRLAGVRPRRRRDRRRSRTATPTRYAAAVRAIVADFESRDEHLTGVPVADTALMLERLAEARGLAAHPASALLP